MSKPPIHRFRVPAKSESVRGDGVEHFADRCRPVSNGADDPLSHIIGVDVMQHFQTQVRQGDFFTSCDSREDFGLCISLGVDWHPTFANDVTGSEACRRKAISSGLLQQPAFNLLRVERW